MVAAKVKTVSFKVDPIVNRMDSEPARQPATTKPTTVINRITNYDFRTRKFQKPPIGSVENIRCIVPLVAHTKPRKTIGENAVQLRRSHWAPEMSLYRAYFVPGMVDPSGLACQEDCPKRKTELVLMRPHNGDTDETIGVQIKTTRPFSAGLCGGFKWSIRWKLKHASGKNGGYVLQHVRATFYVEDCDGKDITTEYKEDYWNHPDGFERWETFEFGPHRHLTKHILKGGIFDDTYAAKDKGKCTRGFAYLEGKYGYVDGKIPNVFKPLGDPTGILPATATDPKINMGHTRDHTAIVKWDCCPK